MKRVLPILVVSLCLLFISDRLLAQNAPIIFCPGDINVNLDPGECETPVNFNVFASANGNPNPPLIIQTDGTGYTSGSTFPRGVTSLVFVAVDTASPFPFPADTCMFNVNVIEYVPGTTAIVTDDDLTISMPSTCEMFLTPGFVLEGSYGCYDDFTVDVENTGSNYIGPSYVGQTITYTITNNVTGMMGWGDATIEDKSPPLITGCDTVRVNCLADLRPVSEGGEIPEPGFVDCNPFTVQYLDMITQGTCQDTFTSVVMRVWTAVDELGNVGSCNQVIVVDRILLTDIAPICPPMQTVQCVPNIVPDFSPAAMGYPTAVIDGVTYEITDGENSICNITASYSDQIVSGCGASYKILRTWTIMDWCLPLDFVDNPWTCTQIIEYMDQTAPVATAPADMVASANLPDCRSRPIIPAVDVVDCSDYTVFISTPVGPIVGNGGQVPAPGLPLGNHLIEIKITDACGNATNLQFHVTVEDQTQPTPVCDSHTTVPLNNDGYAIAYATSFDDGSTDNCCLDRFEVIRYSDNCTNPANLVFGEFIEFCCADVGQPILVALRVWDCYGNFNQCNVQVEVQDLNGPSITCPPNQTLFCGDDYNNPALVGEVETDPAMQGPNDGFASDNCGAALVVTSADAGQVSCGSGTIVRTYTATDPAGLSTSCQQVITVVNNNPFTGTSITFPADITVFSCNALTDPSVTGEPTLPAPSGCYSLVWGHDPDLELASNDACKKILRDWYVIDWCQYDPNNPNSPGIWTQTQTISVMDQEGPTFPVCTNLTFCNFKDDCSDLAPDLSVSATDACTDDNLISYSWTVDLYDDGLTDPAGYTVSGSGQNTTNDYPLGTHQINYTAFDGCGNTGSCSFLFSIVDCKAPTVYCRPGLVVEIMATGMVPVDVVQLEEGTSFDNCTSRTGLRFSFSPDVTDTQRLFDCTMLGQNPVQVWATDEAGNQDFCNTVVTIQDNMNACGGPLVALSGAVANEDSEGVPQVEVEINGDMTGMSLTDTDGIYSFANVPVGHDYSITPHLDTDPLNGVTTLDLYYLQRHILGVEFLDSPYKIIAGDANNSGMVTTSDVIEIRKLILHVIPRFSQNTSWRFVDGTYTFPNANDPFEEEFPEVCNINNFTSGNQSPNFVAIKIGDLNGTALLSANAGAEDRDGADEWLLTTADRKVEAGETFTVEVAGKMAGMLGYQFTFGFDNKKLEVKEIKPGKYMDEGNFGLAKLEEGALTASWFQVMQTKRAEVAEPLFEITFLAKAGGMLSDMVNVNSRFTKAESYGTDGTARPIALSFGQPDGAAFGEAFELFQNKPNPFSDATVIGFQLPEASSASLTIFDVSGKAIKKINGQYAKGYHEVNINNNDLSGLGIYYYRLETPGHTATMKMTVL
ncbi:MAG TPA: T9SS type A sorting domain-containing protein [Bacteroidetes bacterium]|nr:T9SS type A sorting domain-containing protein [Bacteroidota bacterium]